MALILGYHRVAAPELDPFGLCVTPSHFDEQVEQLRRHCHPLPLMELAAGVASGDLPPRAVAVTLDDGYADALTTASAVLTRYDVPATFFVTTVGWERSQAYWWDLLARALAGAHDLPAVLDDPAMPDPVATGTAAERLAALKRLHGHMLPLPASERDAVLARIVEWSGVNVEDDDDGRPLRAEELLTLASRPSHEVGSHSANHLLLPRQAPERQRAEVHGGKARLEGLLGRPVEAFCYPFGAWDESTLAVVREAGFRAAVTVREAPVEAHADPLLLPRVEVGDWDGDSFARRLWPLLP